jgi:hypothetical protein
MIVLAFATQRFSWKFLFLLLPQLCCAFANSQELRDPGNAIVEKWQSIHDVRAREIDRVSSLTNFIETTLEIDCPGWWKDHFAMYLNSEVSPKGMPETSARLVLKPGKKNLDIRQGNKTYSTVLDQRDIREYEAAKVFVLATTAYVIDTGTNIYSNRTYKLDLATGEKAWIGEMQRAPTNDSASHIEHFTQLTVDQGRIVVFGMGLPWLYVFALEEKTGEQLWEFSLMIEPDEKGKPLFTPR